jgi:uncharacterized protein YeaO (DUF488 family)
VGTDALDRLRALAQADPLTMLTATRDLEHAHTAVRVTLINDGNLPIPVRPIPVRP